MDLALNQVIVEGRDKWRCRHCSKQFARNRNAKLRITEHLTGTAPPSGYIKNCSALDDAGKNRYRAVFGLPLIPPDPLPQQPPGEAGQVAAPRPEVQVLGAGLEAAPPEAQIAPQPIPSHLLGSQQVALPSSLFPSPQLIGSQQVALPSPLFPSPHLIGSQQVALPSAAPPEVQVLEAGLEAAPSEAQIAPQPIPSDQLIGSQQVALPSPLFSSPQMGPSPLFSSPQMGPSPLFSSPQMGPSPLFPSHQMGPSPLAAEVEGATQRGDLQPLSNDIASNSGGTTIRNELLGLKSRLQELETSCQTMIQRLSSKVETVGLGIFIVESAINDGKDLLAEEKLELEWLIQQPLGG
ncbi:hypothetical protein ACJRO7_023012 [Eucalyptus globulus]|uniref:C2H2-type domain-containing protein n=1 Tax=Eucalyptus globulus TaxID=34317 RepID=A0ABD3K2R9_EUCGL